MAKRLSPIKKAEETAQEIQVKPQKNSINVANPKEFLAKLKTLRIHTPKTADQKLIVAFTTFGLFLAVILLAIGFIVGALFSKASYLQNPPVAAQGTAPTTGTAVQPGQKVNVALGNLPIKGDKNAKVTVIEFADFRCPFCEQFYTQTLPQFLKDYVDTGKVKFVFRNFAFLGPASIVAADAAECANDQGKFWEYHDYLYKNQPDESNTTMYNTDTLTQAAVTLGLNGDQFKTCLATKKDDSIVSKDMADGQAAGISGTPSFFINGTILVGAQQYSAFKTLIDQELSK